MQYVDFMTVSMIPARNAKDAEEAAMLIMASRVKDAEVIEVKEQEKELLN